MDTGMNEKRPQQVGTSWGRLFFRWGLGAEAGSPCKTRCERPGSGSYRKKAPAGEGWGR